MAVETPTIANMAKKKPQGKKPNRAPNYPLFIRIPPELGEAFDEYVASLRPTPTMTKVVQMLIENYLSEAGVWPRQNRDDVDRAEGGR